MHVEFLDFYAFFRRAKTRSLSPGFAIFVVLKGTRRLKSRRVYPTDCQSFWWNATALAACLHFRKGTSANVSLFESNRPHYRHFLL
jgi:hypothetical protein